MNIEQSIQQRIPFADEYQKLVVNLIYTNSWIAKQMKAFLRPYGITPKQYNVLRILKGANKPISTSIIRKRLLDPMSDASRLIDRMVEKKLVQRATCQKDKRLVDVALSSKGESLLSEIREKEKKISDITSKLGIAEAKKLNALLDKIRA